VNANDLASLIPLGLLLVFAYFVLIRPARRRAQSIQAVQTALSVGDEVMLTSGIFGFVTEVGDERLTIQVAPGVEFAVARQAVASIVHDVPADEPSPMTEGHGDTADAAADPIEESGSAHPGSGTTDADPTDAGTAADGTAADGTENDGRGAH
jgi:preprotein translocase subunit YajC